MAAPIYATLEQLRVRLNKATIAELPANSSERLRMASRQIDSVLIGARYETDINEQPTDVDVIEILKDATLAQVQYWVAGYGSEYGPPIQSSVSFGSVTISSKTQSGGEANKFSDPELAPQAAYELRRLFPISATIRG